MHHPGLHQIDPGPTWAFRFDPLDQGHAVGWHEADLPADQAPGWMEVPVPAAWQSYGRYFAKTEAELDHGFDVAWYRRRVNLPLSEDGRPQGRWWLCFDAIATTAEVYVNGESIARHSGPWQPVRFEVPWRLLSASGGQLSVAVRVDRVRPGEISHLNGYPQQSGHLTKGFHDILSMQAAGLWGPIRLVRTGPLALCPDGLLTRATLDLQHDPPRGRVDVAALLEPVAFPETTGRLRLTLTDPDGQPLAQRDIDVAPGTDRVIHSDDAPPDAEIDPADRLAQPMATLDLDAVRPWSPDDPALYRLSAELLDDAGQPSDHAEVRVGFRQLVAHERTVRLNGEPLFLAGILDWGHEPDTVAPAPTPETVRHRFTQLQERGFNAVCVCMWYPPEHFYDIADEMGVLLWQEHPVWKSDMNVARIDEYRMHFRRYLRRDLNHPSVAIVSGACEHERFHPELAAWWWAQAKALMPERLVQVQTAFLSWVNLSQTDFYDEHTYECTGRWLDYLADLDLAIGAMEPRPFLMGESVLYVDWPDTTALAEHRLKSGGKPMPVPKGSVHAHAHTESDAALERPMTHPWWLPGVLDAAIAFEDNLAKRHGEAAVQRFRRDANLHHRWGRKRQTLWFRAGDGHAGLIHNAYRDVAVCPLGVVDDFERWRLPADETRSYLGPVALFCQRNDGLEAFFQHDDLPLQVGLRNDGPGELHGMRLSLEVPGHAARVEQLPLHAGPGGSDWTRLLPDLPEPAESTQSTEPTGSNAPTRPDETGDGQVAPPVPLDITLHATRTTQGTTEDVTDTRRFWLLPESEAYPPRWHRHDAEPHTAEETALEFEEARYSSGWGLPIQRWAPIVPLPLTLWPTMPICDDAWLTAESSTVEAPCLVTHRLTDAVLDHLTRGGRVLLMPSRATGSLPTAVPRLWGVAPLVMDEGPLTELPDTAVLQWVDCDLHRRWLRVLPTTQLGLEDRLTPYLRYVGTHESGTRLNLMDAIAATRVGDGLLGLYCCDPHTAAGRYLADRFMRWLAHTPTHAVPAALDLATLRALRIQPPVAHIDADTGPDANAQ